MEGKEPLTRHHEQIRSEDRPGEGDEIDAVVCSNDGMAGGVVSALKARGLEGIPSVVADARGIRKAYLDEFSGFLRAVERGCRARQIDYLRLNTQLQFDVPLSAFLTRRQASKQ